MHSDSIAACVRGPVVIAVASLSQLQMRVHVLG
jgi:hypothetical protein